MIATAISLSSESGDSSDSGKYDAGDDYAPQFDDTDYTYTYEYSYEYSYEYTYTYKYEKMI
jgi:hypothetical protein